MPGAVKPAEVLGAFARLQSFQKGMFFASDWDAAELDRELRTALVEGAVEAFVDTAPDALPALTPLGFRLLLGEYLLRAIDNPEGEVAVRLVLHLDGVCDEQYWNDRIRALSELQVRAICTYLEGVRACDLAGAAQVEAASALKKWRKLL